MRLEIYRLTSPRLIWPLFAPHHYLRDDLSNGARCWVGVLDDHPIAFTSSIRMPHKNIEKGWREHRTVVLPDYQGLGFGMRLSEWLGEYHIAEGERLYSRTTHPRIGEARNASPLWRNTGKNLRQRQPWWKNADQGDAVRIAYSHEYVGNAGAAGLGRES